MNWQDEGFLISKIKFRENANIINIFTSKYGKVSGIVYGGNSRKVRNHLQISNKIFVFYSSKSQNRIGYFKTELVEAISPQYFNDKKKTTLLLSVASILNTLLPESQPYIKIFDSLENLLKNLVNDNWAVLYIYWELNILKELGFDPNLKQFTSISKDSNDLETISIDGIKYQIPIFLMKKIDLIKLDNKTVKKALTFTRNLMMNKFFLPNNLIFPKSRILLENYFS